MQYIENPMNFQGEMRLRDEAMVDQRPDREGGQREEGEALSIGEPQLKNSSPNA